MALGGAPSLIAKLDLAVALPDFSRTIVFVFGICVEFVFMLNVYSNRWGILYYCQIVLSHIQT